MSQAPTHDVHRIVPLDHNGDEMPLSAPLVPVQRVQTQYTTAIAVQQPRVLKSVERRALEEAAILGEDAFYAWGSGKDRVEGPSKHLAMMLVRVYGNCAVDLGEVQETPDAWIFTAKFIDLETGFTLSRQFRQSKRWVVHGKFDESRKEDIRFQIGQSKAVRNVILNAVPGWLVTRGLDKAKGGVRAAIEEMIKKDGLPAVQSKYIKALEGLGASEARVLGAMGCKVAAALTIEDLVIMAGGIAALKSGAETVDVLFPLAAQEAHPFDPSKTKAEQLAEKIRAEKAALAPKQPDPPVTTPEDAAAFQASIAGDANKVPAEITPKEGDPAPKPNFLEDSQKPATRRKL